MDRIVVGGQPGRRTGVVAKARPADLHWALGPTDVVDGVEVAEARGGGTSVVSSEKTMGSPIA